MKLWNVGSKEIVQLYNNLAIVIPPNSIKDYELSLAAFLLSKAEVRGKGLVQLKDNDNKKERYIQGRNQIYNWAVEKYADFVKHGEERGEVNKAPLQPHKEIVEYKKLIDEYEKWEIEGSKVPFDVEEMPIEGKIFACPLCSKEFDQRGLYFEHLKTHEEEKVVNTGTVKDKSSGKS